MPSIPSVWLLSWRTLSHIGFANKTERGGKEREKIKRRKGRESRKGEEAPENSPLNGPSAACAYELYSRKMAEFAYSEPYLASQSRYLHLVSMGVHSLLGQWSGSYIFFDIAR
jgi:hypothetical protein